MKRLSVVMIVVIVLSALLTACGSGAGGGSGAAAAAKSFFDSFSQLDFAKMKDLTCDAQKPAIDQATQSMSALGDASKLKDLITIDTSGLKFDEKSVSGDKATVVVTGTMKVTAMGQSQDQPVNNEELPMVKEGGQWKVCGGAGLPIP
jgi:predicted small secreted protein